MPDDPSEIDLTDADILEAMGEIPGYLDITTADFRTIYHLAHRHALDRLFRGLTAGRLMRTPIQPLEPGLPLARAIPQLVRQGLKALPVVDPKGQVLGILTETDILRALGDTNVLVLLEQVMTGAAAIGAGQGDRSVADLMTAPAVTVPLDAGFRAIIAAFAGHGGRGMPVCQADGRLAGLLLRKDFLGACHREHLL